MTRRRRSKRAATPLEQQLRHELGLAPTRDDQLELAIASPNASEEPRAQGAHQPRRKR